MFQGIKTVADGRIWLALALLSLASSAVAVAAEALIIDAQDTTPRTLVEGHVIASSRSGAAGALLHGITPANLAKLMPNAGEAAIQSLQDFGSGRAVIIGRRLAEQLSLGVGDSITLVAPHGVTAATGSAAPLMKIYTVAAILTLDSATYDGAVIFMAPTEVRSYGNR